MMKHKLIVIGLLGQARAYLDIPREKAIERFKKSEDGYWMDEEYMKRAIDDIYEFEFDDEFGVYTAWSVKGRETKL